MKPSQRPPFSSLPLRPEDPPFSAWTLYGSKDELGTLNLLTPDRVLAAAKEIQLGESFGLNLPLNQPHPPSHNRLPFTHKITHKSPRNVHDDVIEMNTQCSTQWDGFRHYGYQDLQVCYNGVTIPEISGPDAGDVLGVGAWCKKGVVGRGVLLDYARYAESQGIKYDPLGSQAISLAELRACAQHQGTIFKEGDILMIRFGWTKGYQALDGAGRSAWAKRSPVELIGVQTSKEMAEWLWNTGFSAVAADTVAFERQPFDPAGEPGGLERISLHEILLGGWGMPIGEMWDLEAISEACDKHKRPIEEETDMVNFALVDMAPKENVARLRSLFEAQRGVWTEEWESLAALSPEYLESYLKLQAASQNRQRLPPKIQELCYIAVAASVTHIHLPAVRAHVQAALALGATGAEIMEVIGLTYLLGVHTVTLGFPILAELMEELDLKLESAASGEKGTSLDDERSRIKDEFVARRGFWPPTFDILLELDPQFFEQYADFSSFSSRTGVLEPKYREVVICAFDAATTHLYGRGTKIHMRNALKLGATPEEIIEMLEITSLMGIDGVTHSAPALTQQLAKQQGGGRGSQNGAISDT
ncbi:hypothetical protein KCU71_g205, partial [Aureobasidium melanogenum]